MASSLLLALTLLLPAQIGPAKDSKRQSPEPPTYPWVLEPIDAIYGHLSEGSFQEPYGVCFEPVARELYVADSRNGLIGIFDAERTPLFAFGGPAQMIEPRTVIASADGTIHVLDALQTEVRVFNYRGEPGPPLRFALPGLPAPAGAQGVPVASGGEPSFARIGALARDTEGRWYVADNEQGRIMVFDAQLQHLRDLPPSARVKRFRTVTDLAVSARGLVAASDMQGTPSIHVWDAEGKLLSAFGERDIGLKDFTAPAGLAFDEDDYLYVVDLLRHDLKVFTPNADFLARFGGWFSPKTRGRAPGELLYPIDVAIDPQGPVYIAERFGQRVQVFKRVPRPLPELDRPGSRR